MSIVIDDLSFDFKGKSIFEKFSLHLDTGILPTVILGPSGCGKTTLLRLIAGLLPLSKGSIHTGGEGTSFVFQEDRFLPWFSVLDNICLPLEKKTGKKESRDRALHYLKMVSLEDYASAYPVKLSGGQRQRASIARAFAYPSEILLMDEPFQSLDIPLRIELMDMCLSLLSKERRMTLIVTHDPREAIYMGDRIIILTTPPEGIIFDEKIALSREERNYWTHAAGKLEERLIKALV